MSDTLRWGIIGTGSICRKFAEGLRDAKGAELVAVGSRTMDRAEEFGQDFDIPHCHGSYADLVADADVQAVYIGTPHVAHADNALQAIEAGQAVLCEKPFTLNAAQARRVVQAARAKGVFCMEAMWTRFLPSIVKLRQMLSENVLGEVRMVLADFGFRGPTDPNHRLLNPELGGGGLLDVGVYPISLASMVLGSPEDVASLAEMGPTGVDTQAGVVLRYPGGKLAVTACGVRTKTPHEAWILGTQGRVKLHAGWWGGSPMTWFPEGADPEEIAPVKVGNGYNYQAEEVARCIAAGKTESAVMPLDETIAIMDTLDKVRSGWGLTYPGE